jgi:hypothetical protein
LPLPGGPFDQFNAQTMQENELVPVDEIAIHAISREAHGRVKVSEQLFRDRLGIMKRRPKTLILCTRQRFHHSEFRQLHVFVEISRVFQYLIDIDLEINKRIVTLNVGETESDPAVDTESFKQCIQATLSMMIFGTSEEESNGSG